MLTSEPLVEMPPIAAAFAPVRAVAAPFVDVIVMLVRPMFMLPVNGAPFTVWNPIEFSSVEAGVKTFSMLRFSTLGSDKSTAGADSVRGGVIFKLNTTRGGSSTYMLRNTEGIRDP